MWLELVLVKDDIDRLLGQLLPLEIELGSPGDRVVLSEARGATLVPGEGVRLACSAEVRWSVLGVSLPFTVREVRAMLRPVVIENADGTQSLAFHAEVEHADFVAMPAVVDGKIVDKLNEKLRERRALCWNFSETLARTFKLPATLHPLRTLAIEAACAKLRITADALVMAFSFRASCFRCDDATAPVVRPPVVGS